METPGSRAQRLWLALGLAVVVALAGPAPASGAAFIVTKTADTVDGSCDADCSLREAIIAANASPGADVITLPAGTYTIALGSSGDDASADGDLDITDNLTITGAGAASTVIDGGSIDRVLHITFAPSLLAVSITGVTVQNGVASPDDNGGGILNEGGTLTLSNVTVADNVGGNRGGGIANSETLELTSTTIRGNASGSGGGIMSTGTATLTDVVVGGNSGYEGGGIHFDLEGTATLTNVAVTGNEGYVGGGILNHQTIEVKGSTISGNTTESSGGGIYNSGQLTLTNSTVSANTVTSGDGGGVVIANQGSATLRNVTISGNSAAASGGGIDNIDGTATLSNTILATSTGGNCAGAGTIASGGHNLEDDGSCGFTGPGDLADMDPLLGPLSDNGGSTRTHALQRGSPAIDAGADAGCPATDQRGVPRPADGNGDGSAICDIGAVEAAAVEPAPSPTATVATEALPPTGGGPSSARGWQLPVALAAAGAAALLGAAALASRRQRN